MSEHTEGKLFINPAAADQICAEGNPLVIASTPSGNIHNPNEANARRLVAAWNACIGISTEALEAGAIQDRIASACGELYEVKRANAELLAALRELSAATLHMAQSYNRAGRGEGEDTTRWNAARQRIDTARKAANSLLASHTKAPS